MFTDKVTISVQAGKGGDGKLSFRHSRSGKKGGPDGGDGGHGGNVIVRADHNTSTLLKYRTNKIWKAAYGDGGGKNRRHGKSAEDLILPVPPGTIIFVGAQLLADLVKDGVTSVVAKGGRGGFGNAHFTSSTRQAPRLAELGESGETKQLTLELKMVADVGLVGLPNSGKSTLLSVISNAKPEIGDYAFTTLAPNLGMVKLDQTTSFLAADIPGLIEGASKGKGLGDEFLRHIERTKVLVHLIDVGSSDIVHDYKTIQQELRDYRSDLTTKPQIIAVNKIDSVTDNQVEAQMKLLKKAARTKLIIAISAVARTNLSKLLFSTSDLIKKSRPTRKFRPATMVISAKNDPNLWVVKRTTKGFAVEGRALEKLAERTNMTQPQAIKRLFDILIKRGVLKEIKRLGGGPGAYVIIGKKTFTW